MKCNRWEWDGTTGGASRKQVTRPKLLTEGGVADTGQDNRMRGEPLLSHDHGGVGLISTAQMQ